MFPARFSFCILPFIVCIVVRVKAFCWQCSFVSVWGLGRNETSSLTFIQKFNQSSSQGMSSLLPMFPFLACNSEQNYFALWFTCKKCQQFPWYVNMLDGGIKPLRTLCVSLETCHFHFVLQNTNFPYKLKGLWVLVTKFYHQINNESN